MKSGPWVPGSFSESSRSVNKGCQCFHTIWVKHNFREVKVVSSDFAYQFVSCYTVSWAVEYVVVDGFTRRRALPFVYAGLASVGF